jgi:hypothetical protein
MVNEDGRKTSSLNVRMEPLTKALLNRLAAGRSSTPSQLAREGILMLLEREGLIESPFAHKNREREQ